ncbi:hypothetical protein DNTS_032624 [Danionella cerebrum]|uniref:Uncharacterized protein n=1 Tax=Danionella cerebrum TaxID=2873325 RepID=A0A553R763_9TELE|nr:hypothetical protein DNTS_032624 [Danionella translucida]
MKTVCLLCFAMLLISLPFSSQGSPDTKSSSASSSGTSSTSNTNSSAVGLIPESHPEIKSEQAKDEKQNTTAGIEGNAAGQNVMSAALSLLVPAVTLTLIHNRF